jgi:hypothetical protein
MNYRLMTRDYYTNYASDARSFGVYGIADATKLMAHFRMNAATLRADVWLEPTEEKVYRIHCRDYRYDALEYRSSAFASTIGRMIENIDIMKRTQRPGEVGADFWLVEEET